MNPIHRSVYRAQAQPGQAEAAAAPFKHQVESLALGLASGDLLTISLFRWEISLSLIEKVSSGPLHPPDDLEVVLPVKITLENFLKYSFVNPWGLIDRTKGLIRLSRGILVGEWENTLFPADEPGKRQSLIRWARILLFGHLLIVVVCVPLGLWMIPVLITLAPFYGGLLLFLCNNTQHVGLQDNAPDFRLCTRTILLNPVVRFLYWHMNFHIEHHMYAAVPCYNLGRLHDAIKHDLPRSPNGLLETWRAIIPILQRQKVDPQFEFVPELPRRATA